MGKNEAKHRKMMDHQSRIVTIDHRTQSMCTESHIPILVKPRRIWMLLLIKIFLDYCEWFYLLYNSINCRRMYGGRINLSGQGKSDQEILYAIDRSLSQPIMFFLTGFDNTNSNNINKKDSAWFFISIILYYVVGGDVVVIVILYTFFFLFSVVMLVILWSLMQHKHWSISIHRICC